MNISPERIASRSPAETRRAARIFARRLRQGDVVALTGELGAGKTTFVQAIAREMGVRVLLRSPSFIIASTYHGRALTLHHLDLYRLAGSEPEEMGLEEYMNRRDICVIEWAERLGPFLPADRWDVRIEYTGPRERRISIERIKQ